MGQESSLFSCNNQWRYLLGTNWCSVFLNCGANIRMK